MVYETVFDFVKVTTGIKEASSNQNIKIEISDESFTISEFL
jgi:hypothetical protein